MTIVLLFFFFTFVAPVHAAPNFFTDYHVIYSPTETGITHATLQVSLTNTTTQFYSSSYKIQLGFDDISNVRAVDEGGPITPVINKNQDGYTVDLTFNTKAVGLGNKNTFTVTFDTNTLSKKHGRIWEINIPGIANSNDFSSFVVEVKPPPSFGNAAYIKPKQENNSLVFNKDQLGKSGISISFGDKQAYSFQLSYHLANKNVYPITSEIALPPSTNYQEVYIDAMNPRPKNVILDKDGNWLAQYTLLPAQQLDIDVAGKASVSLSPKQEELTDEQITEYTKEQPYWESHSDKIREIADELRTPQAIYSYVLRSLKYDFTRVTDDQPRLGALATLQHPYSAVCREFTDLFIALARASGIPAREVNGFAFTENPKQRPLSLEKDILHAWPEYYDTEKKTWIMVDPTWGSTTGGIDYFETLDFDHVAFIIKGMDSTYPISAGGYKVNKQPDKDINVTFADTVINAQPEVQIYPKMPDVAFTLLPIKGEIVVENTGTSRIPGQNLFVESEVLFPNSQTVEVPDVPPFGSATIPFEFKPPSFLTNRDAGFTIRYASTSQTGNQSVLGAKDTEHRIKVAPFFMTSWGIGGMTLGILTITILIIARKIWRVRFSQQG